MKIIIFSTKLYETGLFGESSKTVTTDALSSFFINHLIHHILNDNQLRGRLKNILFEYAHNNTAKSIALKSDIEQFERLHVNNPKVQIEDIILDNIEFDVDNNNTVGLSKRTSGKMDLVKTISNLAYSCSRPKLKQLDGQQHIYAIKCLEPSERNNNWVPALVDSAREILKRENQTDLELYLVLHDKDYMNYWNMKAYVCTDNEVNKLLKNVNNNNHVHIDIDIAFFDHANNEFVKILENKLCRSNIFEETQRAFDFYRKQKKDKDNIDDGALNYGQANNAAVHNNKQPSGVGGSCNNR